MMKIVLTLYSHFSISNLSDAHRNVPEKANNTLEPKANGRVASCWRLKGGRHDTNNMKVVG
jgi:hypothetical protein